MPCGLQQGSQRCVPNKAHWIFGTILDSNGRNQYLISCLLQHKVIPHPLRNSGTSQKTNEAKNTQKNKFLSSTQPTAQISMPVSANMTPSEIQRVLVVNQMKRIHFGWAVIFSSAGLLIALVEFRPFTMMSEVEVNQWDELSQFLFCERKFTNPIATNGALLEGFMFAIGWRKCSTKNEQFGLYGSLGKNENAKDEWWNQGENLNSVGCILVNYKANISPNQGAFKFASALTFTMNRFKNSPHLDKDASLHPILHTQILTLGQVPNNSKIAYARAGFQQFTGKSLCLYRFPTLHMQNPDACTGSQHFRPFLTPGKPPDNSKNSLHN
ncbi:hypothetical protein O181_023050 [Austropuccinia psidii MF-1]|uniref:Tet-like 2OG-Fe(II) oxygenase domain-containing protein n=1 Tax=Austropuccinia psidii MF-1 TaxID=1389203 RepID=A0A9Q3CHT0_9BASI|nr:hypothetical protein [Austropuccinia psidii MF-1]